MSEPEIVGGRINIDGPAPACDCDQRGGSYPIGRLYRHYAECPRQLYELGITIMKLEEFRKLQPWLDNQILEIFDAIAGFCGPSKALRYPNAPIGGGRPA